MPGTVGKKTGGASQITVGSTSLLLVKLHFVVQVFLRFQCRHEFVYMNIEMRR